MPIKKNQIENAPDVLTEGSKPTTGPNKGAFFTKDIGGITEAFYVDSNGAEIQLTSNGQVIGGGGAGSGEANTGSSLGAGAAVFKQKSGVDLEFRSIIEGTNVTITENADTIEIAASGASGETNTVSNVGGQYEVFKQKSGVDFELRTLLAGSNISLTQNADTIEINASGGGSDLEIEDEGSSLDTAVTKLNFLGAGVTAVENADHEIDITIPGGAGNDEKAAVSSNDTTPGYLNGKLVAGNNVVLTENDDGSDETLSIGVNEYRFTLPAAADLATRISSATGVPSGWTLQTAAAAGEAQFGSDVDTLVITWAAALGTNIAQEITVLQKTISGPDAVQGIQKFDLTAAGKQKTKTDETKAAVYLSGMGVDSTKDIIVFIKLI